MASNRHFGVDLLDKTIEEVSFEFEELLDIAERRPLRNPFGKSPKYLKLVRFQNSVWIVPKQFEKYNYQETNYLNESILYKVEYIFDTSAIIEQFDALKFQYSLSRRIHNGNWRNGTRGSHTVFRLGDLSEGSFRANLWAGIVVIGTAVTQYPDLKAGFNEILKDTTFISGQIESALRASKVPDEELPAKDDPLTPAAIIEERRKRTRRINAGNNG